MYPDSDVREDPRRGHQRSSTSYGRSALAAVFCFVTLVSACTEERPPGPVTDAVAPKGLGTEPPVEVEPTGQTRLRTVYVPAYSHFPTEPEGPARGYLLSVLLSVRNVDARATITLTHVDYFDTSGHRVRRYLAAPRKLRPLETAEFSVRMTDKVGGSGANFLVYWEGPSDVHPLLTETVMAGDFGAGYVAFTSRGVELERRPDLTTFTAEIGNEAPSPIKEPAPGSTAAEK